MWKIKGKCCFWFLAFSLYFIPQLTAQGNDHEQHIASLRKAADKEAYLNALIDYFYGCFYKKQYFSTPELQGYIRDLSLYPEKDKNLNEYKIYYYLLLVDNARYQNRYGEVVFFAEKADLEIISFGDPFSFVAPIYKTAYLNDFKQYKSAINTFKTSKANNFKWRNYIKNSQKFPAVFTQYCSLLRQLAVSYANIKHTINVRKILDQFYQISSYNPFAKDTICTNKFNFEENYVYVQYLYHFTINKDKVNTLPVIKAYDSLVTLMYSEKIIADGLIPANGLVMKLDYYDYFQQADSFKKCLFSYKQLSSTVDIPVLEIDKYQAKYFTNLGDCKNALSLYNKIFENQTDRLNSVAVQQLDLEYVYREAEDIKHLAKVEKHKKERNERFVYGLGVLLIIGIGLTIFKFAQTKQINKLRLSNLKKMSDYQIDLLKQDKNQSLALLKEEIGKDLHDGISGSLASIDLQLIDVAEQEQNQIHKAKLNTIREQLTKIHIAIRSKSHKLFDEGKAIADSSFLLKLKNVIHFGLPADRYTTHLEIDEEALSYIDLSLRINLLYILQECIANIIQHSNATSVSILLSKSHQHLLLTVSDNGNPTKVKFKSGVVEGFKTLKHRMAAIGGTLDVVAEEGVHIMMEFPLI